MALHHQYLRNRISKLETLEAWIVLASIVVAFWIASSDTMPSMIAWIVEYKLIASFVLGFFFTSVLTAVPTMVVITESAEYLPLRELALIGGLGAVCGDLLLFRFVRSRFAERVMQAAASPRIIKVGKKIAQGPFWWLLPVLGALVVASPLPDELGIMLLGVSHLRLIQFVPIIYVANALGILSIALLGS